MYYYNTVQDHEFTITHHKVTWMMVAASSFNQILLLNKTFWADLRFALSTTDHFKTWYV